METVIERGCEALTLVINERGDRVPLYPGMTVTFCNLEGARVKVSTHRGSLACEAEVPESAENLRWSYDLAGACNMMDQQSSLQALIAESRVALNGRL